MSDNKLVKSLLDAATITGLVAEIGWIGRKIIKEDPTKDPSANAMNYVKFTAVMAGSSALTKYLEDQKILPTNVKHCIYTMATIAIMVGGAVLNAATFIGGNYLAKALSGDSGQAALDEKKRHDLALENYQRDYAQYQKDRTQLLDWVAEQDREKNQAFHDFQNTDQALALCNQTHRAKVALPQEPKFSDYYKPSPQQKNGELLFIGASTLALGYAAFRFL